MIRCGLVGYALVCWGMVHNGSLRIPTLFHRDVLHCSHCLIAALLGDSPHCLPNQLRISNSWDRSWWPILRWPADMFWIGLVTWCPLFGIGMACPIFVRLERLIVCQFVWHLRTLMTKLNSQAKFKGSSESEHYTKNIYIRKASVWGVFIWTNV